MHSKYAYSISIRDCYMWKKEVQVVVYTCILVWGCNVMHQCTFTWVRWLKKLIDRSCLNSKAPTNSQIFDYLFVNLLFDEENRSQIFGGRVSRWLTVMPACSQHRMGSESRWLKTSSCSCHSAQGGSQFERKVLETLAKFGELHMYWTPSRREWRAVTPPVWPWIDTQRGVADAGTQQ